MIQKDYKDIVVCEVFLSVTDGIKKIKLIVVKFCKKVAFPITKRLPNQQKIIQLTYKWCATVKLIVNLCFDRNSM